MKDDPIPAADHILRYIKGTGHEDGIVNGGEFLKKPNDRGTSINWMEAFSGSQDEQIIEVRRRTRLTYRKSGRLACLNVGRVCTYIADETRKEFDELILNIIQDPLDAENGYPEDPSHGLITGVPSTGEEKAEFIGDLICNCVVNLFPAVSEN